MNEIVIPSGCSISHLASKIRHNHKSSFKFEKDASFSIGAEGFFISCAIGLARSGNLEKVKIHLSKAELEEYGIKDDSYLASACFINICMQDLVILDRHDKDITQYLLEMISAAVDMDYGAFQGSQSYSLYALDPYYVHPPVLNLGSAEPSEEDFRTLLGPKIEQCMVGTTAEALGALEKIVNSMSLYVFLKEIWENTIHHARQPTTSLRYMKVSRVIYNSLTEIQNSKLPIALAAYLTARSQKEGAKKYLIIDVVDSGYGIYESLKATFPGRSKIEVVERAFHQHSTSKIQRKPIRRGLGLHAAMECAHKLKGLVVITTSGTLCANYDYASDTFLDNIKVLFSEDQTDVLSTSISLIMPV
ncbi:hypothetical protein LOY42_13680 [Pseudomonas sp. B21-023]|uniref:hypothetical protein n=1 Tax=unclassified Pseudomonas TaxID=196821 RepID=UPI0015548EEB|nr:MULTISPECIES: hypothetical protein [unclassified Pseudomonas]NQD78198.1 hypothetical protein [Pseudomonas sp. CM27]UVM14357.1 hypothetical protein LOY42_13680 [Pseudomonas sp. B21-023]